MPVSMTKIATTRVRTTVLTVTSFFFAFEWLLFELMRLPYAPPHDMTTFLGTEKYWVATFMGVLALGWIASVIYLWNRYRFTRNDALAYMGLVVTLSVCIGAIVLRPLWPVSPSHLIWN